MAPPTASPSRPLRGTPRSATLAAASAAWAAVAIVVLTLAGAWATPGYSHASQFISELGQRGAPHEWAVRFAGFLPAGVLLWVHTLAAWRTLPTSGLTTAALVGLALYALGYGVAAFLPCDPGCRPAQPSNAQAIHNAVGLLGYLAAPPSLYALGRQARHWPGAGARRLASWGPMAATVALLGLLTLSPQSPWVGLSQRAIEAAVLSWVVACGLYLRTQTVHSTRSSHEH